MRIKLSTISLTLLCVFYVTLPSYFSFEFGSVLPQFTGSRIILIISLFLSSIILIKRRIIFSWNIIRKSGLCVLITMCILIFVNVLHLSDAFSYSIKDIFSIILEIGMLIWLVFYLVNDEETMKKCLRKLLYTSIIINIFAIIEYISNWNIFYLLTITSRTVYQSAYTRLGMTRAEACFGHSVYYGVYCISLIPFAMYFYENTRKKRYLLIILLNIIGVFASGSRGQILTMFSMFALMLIWKNGKVRRYYVGSIVFLVIIIILLLALFPNILNNVMDIIISICNNFGANISTSVDFGANENGLSSRFIQLSGIKWLAENGNILLGFGSGAQEKNMIAYYWESTGWNYVSTIDVGYVGAILIYGLIGGIAQMYMYLYLTITAIKKSSKNDISNINNAFKFFYISYIINLLTTTGLSSVFWLVTAFFIVYNNKLSIKNMCDKSILSLHK